MTSKSVARQTLLKAQKKILKLVIERFPQFYLVGGTALNLLYHHRVSEDLDFFTQDYSRKAHREIAAYIRKSTRYPFALVAEETRRKYLNMAIYEFDITQDITLKIDFVSDHVPLFEPVRKDGIASINDIYYRKMLAVVGWKAEESSVGRVLAGGRQKTKDLFDVFYLSKNVEALGQWFPRYFDQNGYERLTAWYLSIPKQRVIGELLELTPGCDAKAVFLELDREIIRHLNQVYIGL